MEKNILVLTASPRKGGNSDLMAEAFIKGATESGHSVTKFEIRNHKFNGCRACDTCWSKGTACSFNDGFTELAPLLEKADTIVFATPMYWFGFPSQLKAAIDKLYAYFVAACKIPLNISESILLICGELGEESFNGSIFTYKEIAKLMKWNDKGILIVPEVLDKGAITKTAALEKSEIMGRNI